MQVRRLLDAGVPGERITGLAHGFLYRPLPEWVDPVVEWALAKPAF